MSWNHRVFNVKKQNNGEDYYEVREAYYRNGVVIGSAQLTVSSESLDGIKWIAEKIIEATKLPVIIEDVEEEVKQQISDLGIANEDLSSLVKEASNIVLNKFSSNTEKK